MGMIDLENFDKLPPEMQEQFSELLKQHPHLDSKLKGPSHELNTPTKLENLDDNEIDYSSLTIDDVPPAAAPKAPTLRFKVDPEPEENQQTDESEEKPKRAAPPPQPKAVADFSPVGKQHPVLKKLRASMGMGVYQKPFQAEIGGLTYEMVPLSRDMMTQAVSLAAISSLNDNEFRANQDVAIIAFSVQKIDNVPMLDIFSVGETDLDAEGNKVVLNLWQRKAQAAMLFFHELKDSPPELAEALINYYQQEFPPRNLLADNKVTGYCPEPNCAYQRILDAASEEEGYCPYHGTQLAKETDLPNPF